MTNMDNYMHTVDSNFHRIYRTKSCPNMVIKTFCSGLKTFSKSVIGHQWVPIAKFTYIFHIKQCFFFQKIMKPFLILSPLYKDSPVVYLFTVFRLLISGYLLCKQKDEILTSLFPIHLSKIMTSYFYFVFRPWILKWKSENYAPIN